jgi:hypothetical protein
MTLDNLLVPTTSTTLVDRQPEVLSTAHEAIMDVHQLNTDQWYNQPIQDPGWTPLHGPGVTSSSVGPVTDAYGVSTALPAGYTLVAAVLAGILVANQLN